MSWVRWSNREGAVTGRRPRQTCSAMKFTIITSGIDRRFCQVENRPQEGQKDPCMVIRSPGSSSSFLWSWRVPLALYLGYWDRVCDRGLRWLQTRRHGGRGRLLRRADNFRFRRRHSRFGARRWDLAGAGRVSDQGEHAVGAVSRSGWAGLRANGGEHALSIDGSG